MVFHEHFKTMLSDYFQKDYKLLRYEINIDVKKEAVIFHKFFFLKIKPY